MTESTTPQLPEQSPLPCPRCGGGAEVFPEESDAGYYVMCVQPAYPIAKCWLSLGEEYDRDAMPAHRFSTKEDAIRAWNTRGGLTTAQGNAIADAIVDRFESLRTSPSLIDVEVSYDHLKHAISSAITVAESRSQSENTALRSQLAKAQRGLKDANDWIRDTEEREAAVCPEDVGFEEYIRSLQSQLAQVTSERDRVWQEAVQVARNEAESAAGRAWRIRDRYGDEGRDEEDSEMITCESARNIERALERAARMAHDGITEEDIADTLNPARYPENR